MARARSGVYQKVIAEVFERHYQPGMKQVVFEREELTDAATKLGLELPKNVGDVVYAFRYRQTLPERILEVCPPGSEWVIEGIAPARYQFRMVTATKIVPQVGLLPIKIPDATPEIVLRHAQDDEQALLTRVRYNRLIDIFLGIVAYSLQNHLRTTLEAGVQIEIDELYVGVDRNGAQFIVPVQAKGGSDRIGRAQLDQDITYCTARFPELVCCPVAAQFMPGGVIALFHLTVAEDRVQIVQERHYRLVSATEITEADLLLYRRLSPGA